VLILRSSSFFTFGVRRAGHPQYRDIHLGTALEYAKGKIDILRPVIVGFNATNSSATILENSQTVRQLKQLRFDKLVMINESPLLTALKKVDPGNATLERATYQKFITTTPSVWPTLFEDKDALIKSIP